MTDRPTTDTPTTETPTGDTPAAAPGADAGAAGAAGPVAILIGPPGAGKTTVGALLAAELECGFTDVDDVVAETAGKPVSEIFVSDGEAVFRDMERRAVAECVAAHPGVLALGGGAVMDPATQALLAGQRVVYLETGFSSAAHRVGLDSPRPLLAVNPRARMKELLAQRVPVYESLAWLKVATDKRPPQDIADEVAATVSAWVAAQSGEGVGTGEEAVH